MTTQFPHRRFNPLSGQFVLVSPQRNNRPWQGQETAAQPPAVEMHNTKCFLCAGNNRSNGEKNPAYTGPHVFNNDFPAMHPTDDTRVSSGDCLFMQETVSGEARVICFSERHDLTLARMSNRARKAVVETWMEQHRELSKVYDWVTIFENKGEMMGCSNPHPHGQIWASNHVPNEIKVEDRYQLSYFHKHDSPMLLDYAHSEIEKKERIVAINDDWICVVPWWATWPFETLVLPLRSVQKIDCLNTSEIDSLAKILGIVTIRYDNLFQTDFPYSMGWHGALPKGGAQNHWQLHAHFYPPLLRSATVRKFMVGYELLSEPQRDLTAETAAEMLRATASTHFTTTQMGT